MFFSAFSVPAACNAANVAASSAKPVRPHSAQNAIKAQAAAVVVVFF